MGKTWVHTALEVSSRFLLDVRVGPRTLELAKELMASVAWSNVADEGPLLLVDDHLPYERLPLEEMLEVIDTTPLPGDEPSRTPNRP